MILSRWFKLDKGVEKSREGVFARIARVFEQPRPIDDELWDELEELLLQADVGVHTTDQLLEILRNEVELGNASSSKDLYRLLREELVLSLSEVAPASRRGDARARRAAGGAADRRRQRRRQDDQHRQAGRLLEASRADGSCWPPATRSAPRRSTSCKLWGERVGVPVVAQKPGSDPERGRVRRGRAPRGRAASSC